MYTSRYDDIRFARLWCPDRPADQSSGGLFVEEPGQPWWCRSRRRPPWDWPTAMRTAEGDLVAKPRMQRIGLAWFCRLTREPRRLARRYLLQGPIDLLRAVRAQLICYPGVYYAGMPISDQAEIPDAARNPTPSEPATA
jgi:hypothetical protein